MEFDFSEKILEKQMMCVNVNPLVYASTALNTEQLLSAAATVCEKGRFKITIPELISH